MYQIIKTDCPKGYGYVRDYMGNKCFYGTLQECQEFIDQMEGRSSNGQ